MYLRTIILAVLIGGIGAGAGCTSKNSARQVARTSDNRTTATARPTTRVARAPATRPTLDRKATLAFDEIEDRPVLQPNTSSTTAPSAATLPPPLEALELYAKARDALASNQRFNAVNALERAIQIDPYSAELQRTLARAYLSSNNVNKAVTALQAAAELEPANLRTHTSLGRLLLSRNESAPALVELRLAVQSPDYVENKDEAGAAIADFFLARALSQQGYDRAALDRYQSVLKRLDRPTLAMRSDPELVDWAARPELILTEVGRLAERLGEWETALGAWKEIAESNEHGEDFDGRKHVIDNLIALGRDDEALQECAAIVRRTGASSQSLQLLRDTSRRLGNEGAAFEEMRKLQAERPGDHALLFALADLLIESDRGAAAEKLLAESIKTKRDVETIRKLFELYADQKRSKEAAVLLIESAAARPAIAGELTDLFGKLQRPSRADALRSSDVEKLEVSKDAQAAKFYFVAEASLRGNRDQTARDALDRAAHAKPVFPLALVAAISRVPSRPDLNDAQKTEASRELIAIAEQSDERGPALAEQLRAVEFAARGKRDEAIAAFDRAVKLSGSEASADLLISYADVVGSSNPRYEQTLWRVVSDYPTNVRAYIGLFAFHAERERGVGAAAMNVLQRWLASDPSSVEARMRQAQVLVTSNRAAQQQDAVRGITDIARAHPNEPDAFIVARSVYERAGSKDAFVRMLEEMHATEPSNLTIVDVLTDLYNDQKRAADSLRVLDEARGALSSEPRALYYLSALYARAERKDLSQAVLQDVLKLTPDDPGANNDLGYTWADEGINLERAEAMCRRAVEIEPDNSSFLDSYGWVLYKRGRFEEARKQLESAAGPSASAGAPLNDLAADPVVLDHLGDTLYRLHQVDAAKVSWQRSRQRIGISDGTRADWQTLAASLEKKIEQAQAGGAVSVAPIAEAAAPPKMQSGQPLSAEK